MPNKLNEKVVKKQNKVSETSSKSAPSNVRSVSRFAERSKGIFVTFIYALFLGLNIYHVQSFSIRNGAALGSSSAIFYLIIAIIFVIIAVSINAFYIYYSAKIQNKMTAKRMLRHLVGVGFPLLGIIILISGAFGSIDPDRVNQGTNAFIYIALSGVAISAAGTFIENFFNRARFPKAHKISMFLIPGIVVAIIALIVLSTVTSTPRHNAAGKDQQWNTIIVPTVILLAGAVITFLGAAVISRTSDYQNKLKKLIKYGYVTHLMITFTILTCFLFANAKLSKLFDNTPGVAILVVQLVATAFMILFIGYFSRIRKIQFANPIHNKVILMSYIAIVNALGIFAIFQVPSGMTSPSDISVFSYTFLGISALQTLVVTVVAAFMAFVTIEFKGGVVFFMAMFQVILIVFLTVVIYMEKDVVNITSFMGRFVVLIVYAATIVIYLFFELYWILFLFLGEKTSRKEFTRDKKNIKTEKEKKEVRNA